jgi:hypothetical protein
VRLHDSAWPVRLPPPGPNQSNVLLRQGGTEAREDGGSAASCLIDFMHMKTYLPTCLRDQRSNEPVACMNPTPQSVCQERVLIRQYSIQSRSSLRCAAVFAKDSFTLVCRNTESSLEFLVYVYTYYFLLTIRLRNDLHRKVTR